MSSEADSSSTANRKTPQSMSLRRQNKPLIEKRRRARINECLQQLKALIMKDMGKESPRSSKLEKADILEMTVDYVKRTVHKKTDDNSFTTAEVEGAPFVEGFSRCMQDVDKFLGNSSQPSLQPEVSHKLLSHCRQQLTASRDLTSLHHRSTVASPLPSPTEEEQTVATANDDCRMRFMSSSDVVSASADDRNKESSSATARTDLGTQVQPTASGTPPSTPVSDLAEGNNAEQSRLQLAGPLKVVCGGSVFIVVDQPNIAAAEKGTGFQTPLPDSPIHHRRPLLCAPSLYTAQSGFASIIPVQMNSCLASFPTFQEVATTGRECCEVDVKPGRDSISLTVHNSGTLAEHNSTVDLGSSSPVLPPSLDTVQCSRNDVNNNEVNRIGQQTSSVWRPW